MADGSVESTVYRRRPDGQRRDGHRRGDDHHREDDHDRPAVSVAPDVDDVLSVAFGLGTTDLRVYRSLLDRPGATTHELAEVVGVDRSSVNRSLRRLRERELVHRRRRLLREGGHCYVYTATDVEEARDLLGAGIEVWAERARDELRGALVAEG